MKWTIKEEQTGMAIREFLTEIAGFSRRILIAAKSEQGEILLNGEKETVRKRVQIGDELEVKLPPEQVSTYLFPEKMDLEILYEDDAVLVVNKPAGLPVLPSPKYKSGTLANGVLAHYEAISNPSTIHIVTRLDKDTSGLLLIAKNRLSHSLLAKAQNNYEITRKYEAIAEGEIKQKAGMIDAPIGRKPDSIIERAVIETGQAAVTRYEVLERFSSHTYVEVVLETGRTHQIRVHFSHLNHPLAGDDLYGGKLEQINRQALHCSALEFRHPLAQEVIALTAPIPEDMEEVLQVLAK